MSEQIVDRWTRTRTGEFDGSKAVYTVVVRENGHAYSDITTYAPSGEKTVIMSYEFKLNNGNVLVDLSTDGEEPGLWVIWRTECRPFGMTAELIARDVLLWNW